MDFGRITVDDDLVLYLFGTPGQRRFDFMWEILSEGMLGFIVMVDSTRPETFREARSILETFHAYAPTPYVVAANKQDMKDAWDIEDMRHVLRLDSKVKLITCVATDRNSVKAILWNYSTASCLKWKMERNRISFPSALTLVTDTLILIAKVTVPGNCKVISLDDW